MLKPLRLVAIDDEPLALRRLKLIVANLPEAEFVGSAGGCAEGLALIERAKPDVVLLDIKMRDGSGFDLLDSLPRQQMPQIIFVTAFDAFALKAFNSAAVDYVLKPVDFERLRTALVRAAERLQLKTASAQIDELKAIISNLREGISEADASKFETEFWIRRSAGGFTRVQVDSIEWVSSEDDYVRLHTPTVSYLLRGSIKSLECRIDPSQFTRVHRTALVRTSSIRSIHAAGPARLEVELTSGQRVRAGRVHARKLRQLVAGRPALDPLDGKGDQRSAIPV
jgi:DNA-binding LytR/AlgR family response regulator